MNETTQKDVLAHLQAKSDGLPAGTVLVPPVTCAVCGTTPCNVVNHNFGVCPICHRTSGYLNVGNDHWFVCNEHKVKWVIGANLFSSCLDETPEQQQAEQEKIGFASYEKVAPHYDTTGADEEGDGCRCFKCENSDVQDVEFNAPKLTGELCVGDFYIYPEDEDVIYTTCPLCGCDSGIYGGNRWYTQACCYFHVRDKNISLEVERWVTEHLDTGESIEEVHAQLTASRSGRTPTRCDHVERIYAILHDERTAAAYRKYLETGDDGSTGAARQELGYFANEDSILAAEEDTAHEMAADAAERQDEETY